MTEPTASLGRTLRAGPPDESGYRFEPLRLDGAQGAPRASESALLEPVVQWQPAARPGSARSGLSLAAVLLVTIGIVALAVVFRLDRALSDGAGATSRPVAIPALTRTFVSSRNGFSVRVPDDWTITPATVSWPPDIFLPIGHPALDDLRKPGEARLVVASHRLSAGQTQADYVAQDFAIYKGAQTCGFQLAAAPRIPIGGESGYLTAANCPAPADSRFSVPDTTFGATVFAGGRVYSIGLDGVVDMAYFEAVLATIHLEPASALDP